MAVKNKIQFVLEVLRKAVRGEASQEEIERVLKELERIRKN